MKFLCKFSLVKAFARACDDFVFALRNFAAAAAWFRAAAFAAARFPVGEGVILRGGYAYLSAVTSPRTTGAGDR